MAVAGQAFLSEILREARRPPPPPNTIAAQHLKRTANTDEVFLDSHYAWTRRRYVATQDVLLSGLNKIDADVHAGGMILETYDGDRRLETSKEEQRLFDMYVPDVSRAIHHDWFANGYSAVEPVRGRDGNTLARVLEFDEYVVGFVQKPGRMREYRVYDAEGKTELPNVRLYVAYPPSRHGELCTPLDSVWRYVRLLEAAYEDEYYAEFHRTHPPFVVQPPNSIRTNHDDVLRQGVYADADAEQDEANKRFTIVRHAEEELRMAVGTATEATLDATKQSVQYAASIYGHNDPTHPRIQAAANPPYMNYITLGQDTQMAPNVPVPQQHANFREFETSIVVRVYSLMGIPPQLMSANVEKFASETSLVLRLYNATVQNLQKRLTDALSDIWYEVNKRNYKRALRRDYDTRDPPRTAASADDDDEQDPLKADEIMVKEAQRKIRRAKEIAPLLERYRVVVTFNHLPVIELADLMMLQQAYVIGEDQFVRMAAARFNIKPEHALLTQQQRDKERKRRLKNQTEQTAALAQASLVEVGMEGGGSSSSDDGGGGGGGGGGKPRPKRQAVGQAIASSAKQAVVTPSGSGISGGR